MYRVSSKKIVIKVAENPTGALELAAGLTISAAIRNPKVSAATPFFVSKIIQQVQRLFFGNRQ